MIKALEENILGYNKEIKKIESQIEEIETN